MLFMKKGKAHGGQNKVATEVENGIHGEGVKYTSFISWSLRKKVHCRSCQGFPVKIVGTLSWFDCFLVL